MALNAQLGCKLANVYDISSVYNTLLRQRYESDPRYTPKKPFKDPNTSYTLPKVCASLVWGAGCELIGVCVGDIQLVQGLCNIPYTDAYKLTAADPQYVSLRVLSKRSSLSADCRACWNLCRFWATRPLTSAMHDYITKDTHFLQAVRSKVLPSPAPLRGDSDIRPWSCMCSWMRR